MNYKAIAVERSGAFVNELWRKTGHQYVTRTYTLGEHHLVIRDVSTGKDVTTFSGSRWRDVLEGVRDGWNAYCAVRDA